MPPRQIIVVLAAVALLLGQATTGSAQDPMSGMKMPGHIMIPKGAIYTVADVEFMRV